MQHPFVSIVVVNWNGLEDTRECLRSLMAAPYPARRIIVVDNGSQGDEAGALEREFGGDIVVLRNPENLGFAVGANTGTRRALDLGTDYVLLLNNDTTVDPLFLEEMVEAAQRKSRLGAACPKTYFYDAPDVIYSAGGRASLWTATARQVGRGQRDDGQFERVARRDYADGVCMLIPAAALERVGMLDEEYFMYWEETDWCFRAREQGLHCYYVPAAKIWHKAARSRAPGDAFHFRYRRNAFLFVRKRGTALQLASAVLAHLFFFGPAYFLRHPGRAARALTEARALASALILSPSKGRRNRGNRQTVL